MAYRRVPIFDPAKRGDIRDDIRTLQARGWPAARIARELGMSRATYYRLLNQLGRH